MVEDRDVGARMDVTALMADLAGIGPFFAVGTGPLPGEEWVPVAALGDPWGPLADRIDTVGAALLGPRLGQGLETGASSTTGGSCSVSRSRPPGGREAASIAFQGVAAQVVAPLFAAVAVHGVLPADDVAPALHWRSGGAGPWLWWPVEGLVVPCPAPAGLGALVMTLLAPVVDAVRVRVAVSERVLWGNVASSVASARQLVAAARPEAARRAADVARHLLTAAPLAATAALGGAAPPDVGWTFRRRSCCLYYRVPGGGTCGDCVLGRPAGG